MGTYSLNTTCVSLSIMIGGILCCLSSEHFSASLIAVIHDVRAGSTAKCQMLKALFSLIQLFSPPLCVLLMFSQNRIPHFLNVSFRNSLPSRGIYFVSFGKILSLLEIGLLEDTNYQSACIDHRWGYCISVSP